MSAKQQQSQRAEQELQEKQSLAAVIRENVMHDLGQPEGLHQVQVRPLWGNNYRVNVFVGADAASAKVVHSFFLTADADGGVLTSNPAITKRYQRGNDGLPIVNAAT
jgi:hypothetical protein